MSNELAPYRMHLNALPLTLAPGVGCVAFLLGGLQVALSGMAIWCVFLGLATTMSALRYRRHKLEGLWTNLTSSRRMDDASRR